MSTSYCQFSCLVLTGPGRGSNRSKECRTTATSSCQSKQNVMSCSSRGAADVNKACVLVNRAPRRDVTCFLSCATCMVNLGGLCDVRFQPHDFSAMWRHSQGPVTSRDPCPVGMVRTLLLLRRGSLSLSLSCGLQGSIRLTLSAGNDLWLKMKLARNGLVSCMTSVSKARWRHLVTVDVKLISWQDDGGAIIFLKL